MNIMFLNSIDATVYGGMEDWVRLVAIGLVERGHHVTVAGRSGSIFLERVAASNPEIRMFPLDISGDFNPFTISEIKQELASRAIDTVIVNFNKDLRLGGLAARWSGGVKVIWSLGVDITKDNLIHRVISPKMYDSVLVPSFALKKQVIASGYIGPEDVAVIPIGVPQVSEPSQRSDVRQRFGLRDSDVVAVTSGRLVDEKGHTFLIQAAPEIVKSFKDIKFLFLGDGYLRDKLEAEVKKANLERHFIFAGMVSDVPEILAACDLMIHPSVADSFPVALVEGLRAGLPVVAGKAGGIPEVLDDGKCGLLVEPGNAGELVVAVTKILGDPKYARDLAHRGKERWRKDLSANVMVDRIERYIADIILEGKKVG